MASALRAVGMFWKIISSKFLLYLPYSFKMIRNLYITILD
jgi:hypothetical protein